jgi:hypothetical protein
LHWKYDNAVRKEFSVTDSQTPPSEPEECKEYCQLNVIKNNFDERIAQSDLILFSPNDHGRSHYI